MLLIFYQQFWAENLKIRDFFFIISNTFVYVLDFKHMTYFIFVYRLDKLVEAEGWLGLIYVSFS